MSHDIVLGAGSTGHNIVLQGAAPAGAILDFAPPSIAIEDAVHAIFVVGDGSSLYITNLLYELKIDRYGADGLFLYCWVKRATLSEATVSVVSITPQKLQGVLVQADNARTWSVIADVSHSNFVALTGPQPPILEAPSLADDVLAIVSVAGVVDLDPSAGAEEHATATTSGGSDRTILAYSKTVTEVGAFDVGAATASPAATGRVWSIRLKRTIGSAKIATSGLSRWTPVVIEIQTPRGADIAIYVKMRDQRLKIYDSSDLLELFHPMFRDRSSIVDISATRRQLTVLPSGGWWASPQFVPYVIYPMEEEP